MTPSCGGSLHCSDVAKVGGLLSALLKVHGMLLLYMMASAIGVAEEVTLDRAAPSDYHNQ